jgi:hypothetical protein
MRVLFCHRARDGNVAGNVCLAAVDFELNDDIRLYGLRLMRMRDGSHMVLLRSSGGNSAAQPRSRPRWQSGLRTWRLPRTAGAAMAVHDAAGESTLDRFLSLCDDDQYFHQFADGLSAHDGEAHQPMKQWLVPGLIAAQELTVAFGPPESGKSAFAIETACRLAAGLDLDGNRGDDRVAVLYVAGERASQVRRRADAFCKTHGGPRLENLLIFDRRIDLTSEFELAALTRLAEQRVGSAIGLVIVDTFAAAISGSDSNPDIMARAVAGLTFCQRHGDDNGEGGPAILVVHHSPGNGENRLRGAGQLLAAADTTISISRKRDVVTAQVKKANDMPDDEKPTLQFKMKSVSLQCGDEPSATTAVVLQRVDASTSLAAPNEKGSTKPKRTEQEALRTLRLALGANDNKPVTEGQWRECVYAEAGDISASGKRVRFNRQRAVLDGLVVETDGLFSLPA